MHKSVMGVIDEKISDDPMMQKLILDEGQSLSFLSHIRPLYEDGRLRFDGVGYTYRGVKLVLHETVENFRILNG